MTFDRLVLHNFGPFLGRTSVELAPPDKAHPLVLFGGLNGAGKTTILDALQLILYEDQHGAHRCRSVPGPGSVLEFSARVGRVRG